ncbi:hypothetical protein [Arthrobacter sp. C9C5]|uniref:hypothetical protein n=1 Tax=Arthrobacter sp. C9C5 TaxID=2735267 RepID=UPI001585822C|nr:hypothetical protein [Arthrobacter sp. C9C5]NUU30836.1 hypothetical protein [Arthrobacter sp. C9C5]
MAEASMTLITRAEVTSISDVTTGRKALVLDGNTLELGTTGLRDLSGMFKSGSVLGGRVIVRRTGSTVTWHFIGVQIAANATHPWEIITASSALLPFAPEVNIYEAAMSNGSDTGRILIDAAGAVSVHYGEPSNSYTAVITFNTGRSWPSSLPGVVNGQSVGV